MRQNLFWTIKISSGDWFKRSFLYCEFVPHHDLHMERLKEYPTERFCFWV